MQSHEEGRHYKETCGSRCQRGQPRRETKLCSAKVTSSQSLPRSNHKNSHLDPAASRHPARTSDYGPLLKSGSISQCTRASAGQPGGYEPMAKTLCRRNSSSSGKEVEGVIMVYGCDDVRLNLLMCWITRSSCSSHQSKPVSQPNKQTGGVGSRTHGRSLPSFPLPLQRGDVQVPQRFPMPV